MWVGFATSYVNLFIDWKDLYIWEKNYFGANCTPCIDYFDNILVLCKGPAILITDFVTYCNNYPGVHFTYVTDHQQEENYTSMAVVVRLNGYTSFLSANSVDYLGIALAIKFILHRDNST